MTTLNDRVPNDRVGQVSQRLALLPKGVLSRVLFVLAILGPGFITANIDNDAGGILTYSQAGAQYGYSMLWIMLPITLALIVIQEMCARMGVVTGKGLSDLIREEFGLRLTFVVMVLLVIVNFGNVVTEFIGIASSLELFHLSRYITVPTCAVLVWLLVVKGNYKSVEKIFLTASAFYICYVAAGVLAQPSWHDAMEATVRIPGRSAWKLNGYVSMVVALVGTTIAPWMQFYLQASIVEKRIPVKRYPLSRWDVIIGSIFTDVVAWFIIVACAATLFVHGHGAIVVAADAAEAMRPLAGKYAFLLFSFGLFNASFFSASVLPLSTAYTVCEGMGFESGVDHTFKEAPFFYWLYTLLIAGGAAVVLIPRLPLMQVAVESQVLNGVLLPIVIVFMLRLINRKDLMGEYVNGRTFNIVAWVTAIVVILLSLVLMVQTIRS